MYVAEFLDARDSKVISRNCFRFFNGLELNVIMVSKKLYTNFKRKTITLVDLNTYFKIQERCEFFCRIKSNRRKNAVRICKKIPFPSRFLSKKS